MFKYNSTLTKKTQVLLRLTSSKINTEIISSSFPCHIKHLNTVITKNNQFCYSQKSRSQKNIIVKTVRNPTIDWHCTKPLAKDELGLWFSVVTQPFSTRKHWSILLPAQNLVFRLHWECSKSNDLVSPKLTNVTSLNWFSEKPVYFYVVIPFLGCLGLISSALPNDLKKVIPENWGQGSRTFPIYRLSPFNSLQQIQRNRGLVQQDKLLYEWGYSTLWNYGKDSYIATYSDSKAYLNYLNASNLFKNVDLQLEPESQNVWNPKMSIGEQVLDFFTKSKAQNKVTGKNGEKVFPPSLWEKYLWEKSKINWFWSNWALQDFSLLKEKNPRFIWEKLTGSVDYKIICDKNNYTNAVIQNSLSLNQSNTSANSLFFKTDFELDEFAQKLFSIHLQFPKNILQGLPVSKKSYTDSKVKREAFFLGIPTSFSNSFLFKRMDTLKYSSLLTSDKKLHHFEDWERERNLSQITRWHSQLKKTNFILINGLKKTSVDSTKLFGSFLDIDRRSQTGFKEFYQLFGLVDFTKSFNILPTNVRWSDKTQPFFLDNVFVKFYSDERLNFLKPYFTKNYLTTLKNFMSMDQTPYPVRLEQTKFKKLNFPILFSGYGNSDQIKCASQFKISAEDPSFHFVGRKANREKEVKLGRSDELVKKKNEEGWNHLIFKKNGSIPSYLPLLNNFISNTKKTSYASNSVDLGFPSKTETIKGGNKVPWERKASHFKWRSVGNSSFYWNYFKHFYGSSSLLKPWSSTFDSLVVQKPIKNSISNLLFRNCLNLFKPVHLFPDENFLFNKWNSKKKQGFFYKRITKLEVKKRNSQTSYSRVVSLLWGFRAKYKLDEVLQYQKSKYYQSKKAQQTAHQNLNQTSTTTNMNNQMVTKTLTKRRRYKKYIEFNVLSSWLRDVLYFKKIGRKLLKIKNGFPTYFFNYGNPRSVMGDIDSLSWEKKLENSRIYELGRSFKISIYPVKTSFYLKKEEKRQGGRSPFFFPTSFSKSLLLKNPKIFEPGEPDGRPFSTNLHLSEGKRKSRSSLSRPSGNTSTTLFRTLKNFSRFNKFHPLNSSLHFFQARQFLIPNFGWDISASNPFLVNKTPVLLKKLSLTSSNKRFLQLSSPLSPSHPIKVQFVSKNGPGKDKLRFSFSKNFTRFWTKIVPICLTNFQKNISHTLRLQPAVNSIKKRRNHLFVKNSFILSNKQKFLYYKFTKQNVFKSNRMFLLQDSNEPYFYRPAFSPVKRFIADPSTKLKTNIRIALVNKVSNFSKQKWGQTGPFLSKSKRFKVEQISHTGKRRSLFRSFSLSEGKNETSKSQIDLEMDSPIFGLYHQNYWDQKPFIRVQNKLPKNSVFGFTFLSFDDLNAKFKNLASSFVIWRNKFQIRRDYLLLSYIYLDYLGTLINSFKNSTNLFKFVHSQEDKIRTLSANFDIKSDYFVQSENYKTNLIKPFWSFSIINHLKNNHISVYEQLFNSFDPRMKYSDAFLASKAESSTSIPNFGVLPKNSMSSFSQFSSRTSSLVFNRSLAFSSLRISLAKNVERTMGGNVSPFSFPDSTTLNKNYLDYKTKLLNQKIILLKRQKLISSFTMGLKQVKVKIKQTRVGEKENAGRRIPVSSFLFSEPSNVAKFQWSKFKYRRKSGIYKSRIICKEKKMYTGTLFQNLGIHLLQSNEYRTINSVGVSEKFGAKGSFQNLTFWLCTVVFHLCLIASLITNYKVSINFCLKTLYSSLFILNKYFVYAKYRIQRLISYIYRNNFESFLETLDTAISTLKTQSFLSVQKLNFSFKSFQQDLFQQGRVLKQPQFFRPIFENKRFGVFPSSLEKLNEKMKLREIKSTNSLLFALNNNSFNKLFFLPYSYISSRQNGTFPKFFSNELSSLFLLKNGFKSKILMLFQYVQSKYDTPFTNLQVDSKQLEKLKDLQLGKVVPSLEDSKRSDFQKRNVLKRRVAENKRLGKKRNVVSLFKSLRFINRFSFTTLFPNASLRVNSSKQTTWRQEGNQIKENQENFFGRFLNNKSLKFISTEPGKNIKLYFKVLKWNMLLTLLIGESEVLAELEPYREMHWYFLKKFPIFLRTSSTKDYLSMSEYQADEKIRIIKQKIRQTVMILYLRTRKYESKLQNRVTQSEKNTNYLVRNQVNKQKLTSKKGEEKVDKILGDKKSDWLNISNIWKSSGFSFEFRRRKIKKLSFWKSLLTFLGRYSFLSRSVTLSKRFRESIMLFSFPFVAFGPIGTIFLTYGLKKFILDFDGEKAALSPSFKNDYQKTQPDLEKRSTVSLLPQSRLDFLNDPEKIQIHFLANRTEKENEGAFSPAAVKNNHSLPERYINYICKKIINIEKMGGGSNTVENGSQFSTASKISRFLPNKEATKSILSSEIEFDLEFFTDVQKFVKKYNRVYVSLTKTLNKPYLARNKKDFESDNKILMNLFMQSNVGNKFDKSNSTFQTLKLNDFYDWSYSEKFNQLGRNSISSDTFDPKLRYYRFSTNFSKVLSDVGGFYTNIAAQQELGPVICQVYTGWEKRVGKESRVEKRNVARKEKGLSSFSLKQNFGVQSFSAQRSDLQKQGPIVSQSFFSNFSVGKQSAKNYLLVSGSTNPEAVLLLIQALSAEMGMKLFMEDAKRLQRIGRRGINKATKRLEKLFDIAQANSPALVFIEDIHVIGAKTKMLKVDEEQDDVEILSRSLLSKLIYRKYHKNKSLRESFIDQNLFTGGSSSNRRRSLKPTNPIPTSLVLYQLTRRRALSNFFKSQENPSRRLNNKLFLSKKLSPAFTTNAVLIWKLFKSKIATPNKRIKEAPWYHIPVDAMRSINPLTYSIRVKVAKITLLAIFTMGTRLRLVKDLIRLFEKIQFESYQNFIVFATTNKLSTLDPNLRRPGRLEETISLEGLTGSASSSRSPAFMAILDTFKVHLKNVPGFSKTFNVIDNTLFSTSLNLQEWTVINYLAENAYYSLDCFNHNSGVSNFTPIDKMFLPGVVRSTKQLAGTQIGKVETGKKEKLSVSFQVSSFLPACNEKRSFSRTISRNTSRSFNLVNQNQRMTSFATKNKINSPFSLFSFEITSSNSTASYWQSLFSNIMLQRKTGLFTFNTTYESLGNYPERRIQSVSTSFYKSDKFNLFLIFAYSRSGQSLISFLAQNSSNVGLLTNRSDLLAREFPSIVEKNKLLSVSVPALMFDSDYLINFQLWPEMTNLMSFKKSNILATRRKNFRASFLKFFSSKVGEIIFLNSVVWTTPTTTDISNKNRLIMSLNSGLHNIYNTTSSWVGAYSSIKNVLTTSALYSKTPLLSNLLRLEDVSKPRQKQFFESLNAGMLFEYSDFHYRAFFKKNNISTEENLNLLINQKYMLNNQGRPLRKYVKLEHSNRLWLFRILYTELGSLDNITLNPTSMNYYYRNKIELKQVFKLASYQWWNWHLRKPLDQLEDIQEIAYFPCENKYYTPRRRRWILTNGYWGYWFSFDKNFYFDLYEQYMLQNLHFACLQLDKHREILDYLAKFYIYKEKLSETDIIFALKRYKF